MPQRQSFEYWREAVCRAVLNVSIAHPRDGAFRGRISARRTDTVGYVSFHSSGHDILRDQLEASRSEQQAYLVSLQVSGNAAIRQGAAQVRLRPGEVAVVEGWRPFSVGFDGAVTRVLAVVPRAMLRARAGELRAVAASAPFADLLREYMLRLSDPALDIPDAAAEVLGRNVCNLLELLTAQPRARQRVTPAVRRELLLAYLRRNLGDPGLAPAKAAQHLGISLRSVHKLLESGGERFGAIVLENRLQACARELRDPARGCRRIADIAYACGFGDLSHFNHAFKARFGITPGEMRLTSQ